jgi:hypothetical protein
LDLLPTVSGQAFSVTLSEEQLTALVFQEARKSVENEYTRLDIQIHPDGLVVSTHVRTEAVRTGLDVEADGVPIIVDGQIRFQITDLRIDDRYSRLTEFLTQILINTLNKSLYWFQPAQRADLTLFSFRATGVELREGELLVEGVLD